MDSMKAGRQEIFFHMCQVFDSRPIAEHLAIDHLQLADDKSQYTVHQKMYTTLMTISYYIVY
jgi:hypothetical protein